jgi:predicted RNA-binding protein with PIN domain
MPYFLDGNNLIGHARGSSRPTEEDRRALIAEVSDRLRATRAKAVLFFDGAGKRRSSLGSLLIREAGPAGADEAIVREIEGSRTPREIIVVTADRALSRRARDAGASAISPSEFWSRFGKGKAPGSPGETGKVDVEEWLRFFEDEKNRQS